MYPAKNLRIGKTYTGGKRGELRRIVAINPGQMNEGEIGYVGSEGTFGERQFVSLRSFANWATVQVAATTETVQ